MIKLRLDNEVSVRPDKAPLTVDRYSGEMFRKVSCALEFKLHGPSLIDKSLTAPLDHKIRHATATGGRRHRRGRLVRSVFLYYITLPVENDTGQPIVKVPALSKLRRNCEIARSINIGHFSAAGIT